MYIVMDQCTGGELFDKISSEGSFTERDSAHIFRQMMNAVSYCFSKKICHKDLKPENFMFVSKEPNAAIKLIDFGLSEFFENKSPRLLDLDRKWQDPDEGEGGHGISLLDSIAVLHRA